MNLRKMFKRPGVSDPAKVIRAAESEVKKVIAQLPQLRQIAHTQPGRYAIANGLATLEPVAEAVESCHHTLQLAIADLRSMRTEISA